MATPKSKINRARPAAVPPTQPIVHVWFDKIRVLSAEWARRNGEHTDPLAALAKACGISRASLYVYAKADPESGRTISPKIHQLILIAQTLGVTVNDLLTWKIVDPKTGAVIGESP